MKPAPGVCSETNGKASVLAFNVVSFTVEFGVSAGSELH